MPYTAEISRSNPTCFIFLLDQSGSMSEGFGEGGVRKADFVADVVNRTLHDLVIRCTRMEEIRSYYHISIIGYGASVGPAFSGSLSGQDALIGRLLDQGFVATDIASALIHLLGDDETKRVEPPRQERFVPAREENFPRAERPRHFERAERPEPPAHRPSHGGTGLKADRESGAVSHEPGMVRLTLGVGRDHNIQPGDVLGVIVGITKLPKEVVGVIRLQTKQTFVDVAEENADLIVSKLNGIQFKGRKLWCKRPQADKPAPPEIS